MVELEEKKINYPRKRAEIMNIKKLKIKNFKAIKNCEVNLNSKLNVLTGANNSGKTTILEALTIWTEIFYKLLSKAERGSSKINAKTGDYKFSNKVNYFDYTEFSSIRIVSYSEIFHNLDVKESIEISLVLESEKGELEISFTIKNANGKNFCVYLTNYEDFDYEKFNLYFYNRIKPISICFANPINHLNKNEEKKVNEVVEYLINSQNSENVFRNRVFRINSNPMNIENLERDLATILGVDSAKLEILNEEGRYHKVLLQIENQTAKDISLYGSGTLQILQFLINIYEDSNSDLKMILFDEPDSHIHRNIQKRLIDILLRDGNFQLFLTTHNESFIRSVDEDSLFHIEGIESVKTITPIGKMLSLENKTGIMQTGKHDIIRELSGEEITGLHFIEALEADRIMFVEGKMDAEFLETVFNRTLSMVDRKKTIYWIFNGVDSIFKNLLKYKHVFMEIKNGKSLWEKTRLLIDRDFLNDDLRDKLMKNLLETHKLKNHITESSCMDLIFLKELDKLAGIIKILTKTESSIEEIMEILNKKIQLEIAENYSKKNLSEELPFEKKSKEAITKLKTSEFFKEPQQLPLLNSYNSDSYKLHVTSNIVDSYKFLSKDSLNKILKDTYEKLGKNYESSGFLREIFRTISSDSRLRPSEFEEIFQRLK